MQPGQFAAEEQCVSEADKAFRQLQAEIAALRDHTGELRVKTAQAQEDVKHFGERHTGLQEQRQANGQRRQVAGEEVGRITKRQLSEIKQLTRAPPDSIRRTLIAAWILLHSERFKSKPSVQFDEAKDWPRCQRMLADDNFIPHILNFKTMALCEAPHVLRHVASHFFGFPDLDTLDNSPRDDSARQERVAKLIEACERPTSRGSTVVLPALRSRPVARASTVGSLAGSSRRSRTVSDVKPPLDVDMVSHASLPCGALLRWMLELIREHVEEERLRRELTAVEAALREAEARLARLESDMAEAEAKLAMKRTQAEEKERELQRARAAEAQRVAAQPAPAPVKRRKPPSPPPRREVPKAEVELSGSMAHCERELSSLRVPFAKDAVQVLCGDVEQALLLPKLAEVIKANKGSLKVLLEGHCLDGEKDGADIERSLAVYEWLVQAAAVPPGMLRIKGCGSSQGIGSFTIPVPIHELVATSGPIPAEVQAASSNVPPGLYFEASSITLPLETRAIASAMGQYLNSEEDVTVRIEGHTHSDESEDLGWGRAMAVREVLVGFGVKASRLKAQNCKHLHPLSRLHGSLNRRVELHEI